MYELIKANNVLIFHSILVLLALGKIYFMQDGLLKEILLSMLVFYCIARLI